MDCRRPQEVLDRHSRQCLPAAARRTLSPEDAFSAGRPQDLIDVEALSLAEKLSSSPVVANSEADLTNVSIKSAPEGAEITVDGKLVGSTPSTIKIKSGDHAISITKP